MGKKSMILPLLCPLLPPNTMPANSSPKTCRECPAEIMDMSFATQALGLVYMTQNYKELKNEVYNVPHEIDSEIAMIKLRSMGVTIDTMTEEQIKYVTGWEEGT